MNHRHSAGEKKQAILVILGILIDDSDEEHPLSQAVIGEKLSQRGLNLRRAAISENIERINASLGQDTIIHIPNKGYYFAARFLSDDEIFLLTNLIYASNEIDEETKYLLVDKIRQTLSVYQRNIGRIAVSYERKESDSNSLDTLTKCSLIRKAIQRKKKIRFFYQRINEKGKRYQLDNPFICSPYQIFSYDGWLFLLVNKDGYSNLKVIKITYMVGIQILDSDRTPLDEIEDFKIRNFDMAAYLAQHSSPVTNQPEEIVFLLKNRVAFTPLYEEFGKNFTAVPIDQESYRVSLYGETETFFHFALKYNNYIKVLSPASLVLRLYQYYKQAYEDYRDVPKNYSFVPNPKGALYHYFEKSFFRNEKNIESTDDLIEDFHRQYDLSFYTQNIHRYMTEDGDAVALDENTGKKYLIHMDFFNTDNPARINVETFGNIAHLERLKPEYEQIYYACLFDISKIPFIRNFFSNPTPGMMFNEEGGFLPGNIDVNIRDEEGNIRTYCFEKGYAFTFHDIETTSLPYRYSVVKVK